MCIASLVSRLPVTWQRHVSISCPLANGRLCRLGKCRETDCLEGKLLRDLKLEPTGSLTRGEREGSNTIVRDSNQSRAKVYVHSSVCLGNKGPTGEASSLLAIWTMFLCRSQLGRTFTDISPINGQLSSLMSCRLRMGHQLRRRCASGRLPNGQWETVKRTEKVASQKGEPTEQATRLEASLSTTGK